MAYEAFCAAANVPAFNQPWWLDAVCGVGGWGAVVSSNHKEDAFAAWPYCKKSKWGLNLLLTAPLTPYMGIWRSPGYEDMPPAHQFTFDRQVMPGLAKGLPPHAAQIQKLSPATWNWMPLSWEGYQAQLRYHFLVEGLSDEAGRYRQLNRSVKSAIKQGDKQLVLERPASVSALAGLIAYTFDRQGLQAPVTTEVLSRMAGAVADHGTGQLLLARHKDGTLHSGVYILHTQGISYAISAGNGPGSRASGAFPWLMWQAFRESAPYSHTFNFCGSTMPNVAPLLNGFRARQVPYFEVYRARLPRATPLLQYLI